VKVAANVRWNPSKIKVRDTGEQAALRGGTISKIGFNKRMRGVGGVIESGWNWQLDSLPPNGSCGL